MVSLCKRKRCSRFLWYPCLFLRPPFPWPCLFVGWLPCLSCCLPGGAFCGVSLGGLSFFLFLWGVLVVSSSVACRSLSPLSCVAWSRPVVVSRLGWCASSRSVLVWVSGSSAPLSCRVGRSSPAAVSALVASLRAARASGAPVSLGVRSGWSPSRWFCAVAPASARALAA